MPGLAPVGLLLARTDEMAVAVGNVLGYPNGFEFTVNARLRHNQFVWGKSPIDPLADPRTGQQPELALRLGVRYADGRGARTSSHRPIPVDEADGEDLVCAKSAPVGPTANGLPFLGSPTATGRPGHLRCVLAAVRGGGGAGRAGQLGHP